MAGNMTLATNRDFKSWVSQLKQDIRSAQIKAAIKVNTELLRLYWRMGADICEKQKSASWGDGWLKELSRELMTDFPRRSYRLVSRKLSRTARLHPFSTVFCR